MTVPADFLDCRVLPNAAIFYAGSFAFPFDPGRALVRSASKGELPLDFHRS